VYANLNRTFFLWASIVIIFSFTVLPLFYAFYLSLYTGRGIQLEFGGLENYRRMLGDRVVRAALLNNIFFAVILIPVVLTLSILLSNAINKVKSEKQKGVFSCLLFFPSITSPVAYSFFFRRFFALDGFLNNFLMRFGIVSDPTNYLLTPLGARIAIVIVCLWAWTGFYTLLFLSSLQNINPIIYKIAKADGANFFQIFLKITLPHLKFIILLSSVLLIGGAFQLFAEITIISRGGGPEHSTITLAYYIFQLSFAFVPQFGYAISIGILIFVISAFSCFVQLKFGEKNE